MPFAGDATTNTQLLLGVAVSATEGVEVSHVWPNTTPATHGVLSTDAQGNMSWVPQLVSGLLGNLDNAYFATGLIDSTGSVTLTPAPAMQYRSYTDTVVVGLMIRAYAYIGDATQGSTDIQVAEVKTGLVFDPSAASLAQLWTSLPASFFGESGGFLTDLQLNAVRTRGKGCAPTITVAGQPGVVVVLEMLAYTPYNVALAPQAST